MAIYAIGSMYGATEEQLPNFINSGHAHIGYEEKDKPAVVNAFKRATIGDTIYVKGYSPRYGLYIKAVGIITSQNAFPNRIDGGWARKVRWVWHSKLNTDRDGIEMVKLGKIDDEYANIRSGTFYQEEGPEVQEKVLELLLSNL